MELKRDERPAQVFLRGTEKATLGPGKRFAIGTLQPRVLWLDQTVPDGKEWHVTVNVTIEEKDVSGG